MVRAAYQAVPTRAVLSFDRPAGSRTAGLLRPGRVFLVTRRARLSTPGNATLGPRRLQVLDRLRLNGTHGRQSHP